MIRFPRRRARALAAGLLLATLAPAARATLFAVDDQTDTLFRIDPLTGATSAVGNLGFGFVRALTFVGTRLTGADVREDELLEIDTVTGSATSIGRLVTPATPASIVRGSVGALAFDAGTGALYGADEVTLVNEFLGIDPDTAVATVIGARIGFEDVRGLAVANGTVFGVDAATDQLLTIDPATGLGTAVAPLGFADINGLAFHPLTGLLYGVDNRTDVLVSIDPVTFSTAAVGPTGTQEVEGLASIPAILPVVDATGSPDGTPVFRFDFGVRAADMVLIDPAPAVGYAYRTGAGDPNFASVTLPDIGDGLFELWLFDSSDNPFDTGIVLDALTEFDFTTGLTAFGVGSEGLSRFLVRGIEASSGLDPLDGGAFVTGLSFVDDGRFTGTMTPEIASLPEPASVASLALGLAGLGFARRWETRRCRNERAV